MTTLRVLATGLPGPMHPLPWALYGVTGSLEDTGTSRVDALPAADRLEVVISASQARIACVTLPPLAPGRVAGAAAFAVEDQLAGPGNAQHLAASAQAADGSVRVVIVARELIGAWSALAVRGRRVARIVAEADLLPYDGSMHWCAGDAAGHGGFFRLGDGRALPVGAVGADGSLPTEIALSLRTPQRAATAGVNVIVDAPVTDASLARWTKDTGTTFTRGRPWRWQDAAPAAFANALELLPLTAVAPAPGVRALSRLFVPALAIALAAVVLHIVLTIGEWTVQKYSAWQRGREWTAVAAGAGISPAQAATPAAAAAAIARSHAASKHAHGQPAQNDALPLLARSATALAALPPGTVRSAVYADGHWTFDLGRVDATAALRLDAAMRASGTPALVATSAAGTRMRVGTP
jgi:hypothetical protein